MKLLKTFVILFVYLVSFNSSSFAQFPEVEYSQVVDAELEELVLTYFEVESITDLDVEVDESIGGYYMRINGVRDSVTNWKENLESGTFDFAERKAQDEELFAVLSELAEDGAFEDLDDDTEESVAVPEQIEIAVDQSEPLGEEGEEDIREILENIYGDLVKADPATSNSKDQDTVVDEQEVQNLGGSKNLNDNEEITGIFEEVFGEGESNDQELESEVDIDSQIGKLEGEEELLGTLGEIFGAEIAEKLENSEDPNMPQLENTDIMKSIEMSQKMIEENGASLGTEGVREIVLPASLPDTGSL